MRSLDESREVLYVIRTLDVLMGSGKSDWKQQFILFPKEDMESFQKDFSNLMDNINKGRPLEKELRALLKKQRLMVTRE